MNNNIDGARAIWKALSGGSRRTQRDSSVRERRRNRPFLETLESRQLLSTITWSTSAAPTGGDWNVATNWVGSKVPGAGDTAVIKGLTGSETVYLNSGGSNSVAGLTTDASCKLSVISGSLSLGIASSVTFGGPITVDTGAALSFADNANVAIDAGLSLQSGSTVTIDNGGSVTIADQQFISVSGQLNITDSSVAIAKNAGCCSDGIVVNNGGKMTVTGSSFSRRQQRL